MTTILQLSVAKRQQPIRGQGSHILQPVVANPKDLARQEFARLFNAELNRIGAPQDHKRISWIHDRLKAGGVPLVSREQVRKWVQAIDIPDQANLWAACKRLKLNWTRLQPGGGGPPASAMIHQIHAAIDSLSVPRQLELLEYARYLLAKDGAPQPPARTEGPDDTDSEGSRASLYGHRRT